MDLRLSSVGNSKDSNMLGVFFQQLLYHSQYMWYPDYMHILTILLLWYGQVLMQKAFNIINLLYTVILTLSGMSIGSILHGMAEGILYKVCVSFLEGN